MAKRNLTRTTRDHQVPYTEDSREHRPASLHRFVFDNSVANVFPDMARRSIPNYELAHEIHADLILDHLFKYQTVNSYVLDLGTSRGEFFGFLDDAIRLRRMEDRVAYHGVGLDISDEMLTYARESYPHIWFEKACLPDGFSNSHKYLVVNAMYTLQFMQHCDQIKTIQRIADELLAPEGIMLIGTKHTMGRRAETLYIDWRIRNGYKIEDIVAKSQALQGSMYAPTPAQFTAMFQHAGLKVCVLTHSMVFSTYFATWAGSQFDSLFEEIIGSR